MSYSEWAKKFEKEQPEESMVNFKQSPNPENPKTLTEHLQPQISPEQPTGDICQQGTTEIYDPMQGRVYMYAPAKEIKVEQEEPVPVDSTPPTDVDRSIEGCDVTREDALDLLHFIRYVVGEREYRRVVAKVFDPPKRSIKTIEIPPIYEITDEVKEAYLSRGIDLVQKLSDQTS